MRVIGIDPGIKNPAVVEIDTDSRRVRWMKLPYREDGILYTDMLNDHFDLSKADIIAHEKISPDPKWGSKTNWRFGGAYYMSISWVAKYPYMLVSPQTWQKWAHTYIIYNATDTSKQKAAKSFKMLHPDIKIVDRHDGMIDGYLIARYAGISNNITFPNNLSFLEIVP